MPTSGVRKDARVNMLFVWLKPVTGKRRVLLPCMCMTLKKMLTPAGLCNGRPDCVEVDGEHDEARMYRRECIEATQCRRSLGEGKEM